MVHSDSDERKELSCDDSIGSSYSGKVSSTTAFTNEIAQKLRATKVFVGTTFPLISMSQSATLLGKWNDVDSALIDIAKQTGSEIIADSRRLPKLLNVAEHRDMRSPESIDKLKQKSQYQSSDFAKLDSDYISSPSCSSSTSTSTSTKCSSSNSSSSNSSDSEKELINRKKLFTDIMLAKIFHGSYDQ